MAPREGALGSASEGKTGPKIQRQLAALAPASLPRAAGPVSKEERMKEIIQYQQPIKEDMHAACVEVCAAPQQRVRRALAAPLVLLHVFPAPGGPDGGVSDEVR